MFWYINQKINLENIRIWFLFKMKLLFFIIIINVGVRASLRAPQLIQRVLKLTIM